MKLPISRPKFPDVLDGSLEMRSPVPGTPSRETVVWRPTDLCVEMAKAISSGRVTNNGPHVAELERQLAARLGVRHVVCVSSGTAALVVMLRALGVEGREVIVPSFTFCATPHAVVLAGATPVFADVDPETWMLDPDDVTRRLTSHTAAIMPVDVYGVPYPVEWLAQRFPRMGGYVPVLCDSAPSFGASHSSCRPRARAFSFLATKPFSTMEGGCVATDDDEIAVFARLNRHFGLTDDGRAMVVGLNAHMLEVSALVGLAALPGLDRALATRRSVAFRYEMGFGGLPGVRTMPVAMMNDSVETPTWCYFPILLANETRRETVRQLLAAQGVEARPYYAACHSMPAYRSPTRLPVTEDLSRRVLALPVYSDMTDDEVARVIGAVKEAVR